jgi:hypothetical protein
MEGLGSVREDRVTFPRRFGTALVCVFLIGPAGLGQEMDRQSGLPIEPGTFQIATPFAPPDYRLWDVIAPRLGVAHYAGEGFGFREDYTTLGAFVPLAGGPPDRLTFLDLRGLVADDGHWGGNFGLGRRFYDPDRDRIFGIWASYDVRDTGRFDFNQVSAGFETIGRALDFRGNFYIPVGPDRRQFGDAFLCDPTFQGTHILLSHLRASEAALTGGEIEVGGPVPRLGRYGVRAYLGGYVFGVDDSPVDVGVRGRLDARISNRFSLGAQVQNDREFGTTAAVSVALHWGGIRRRYRSSVDTVYGRFADDIVRNHEIAVATQTTASRAPATDPLTGRPITVIHVNNTAPPGGDGSVEHPLNVLAPAPLLAGPAGIILVYRGDGTPRGMDHGVTLETNQRLLGDSIHYLFTSREVGVCLLPNPLTGRPTITNLAGDAVVLANGNEVAGLAILGPQGNGIRGTGVVGFNLHDNIITTATNFVTGELFTGIDLVGVSGTGVIANNQISGSSTGVFVSTVGNSRLDLSVSGNAVSGNTTGIVLDSFDASVLAATLTNNAIAGNQFGLTATSANGSVLSEALVGNVVSGNGQVGVFNVSSDGSRLGTTVTGNLFDSNGVGFEGVSQGTSQMRDVVTANTFSGAGGVIELFGLAVGTSRHGVTLSGNLFTGSSTLGVELDARQNATVVAAVNQNTIAGAFVIGFAAISVNNGTVCLGLHNNSSIGLLAAYDLSQTPPSTFQLEQDAGTNAGTPFLQSPGIVTVPAGSCVP